MNIKSGTEKDGYLSTYSTLIYHEREKIDIFTEISVRIIAKSFSYDPNITFIHQAQIIYVSLRKFLHIKYLIKT